VPLPELSEERRREYVKLVGKLAEEARVAVRNVRRHEIEAIKKDKAMPEDEAHRLGEEIQKITDEFVHKIDTAYKAKEAEIMEV
jgi:ribosome recycling factor